MNAKLSNALIIFVLVICFGILFSYKSKIYECFVENQQKYLKIINLNRLSYLR